MLTTTSFLAVLNTLAPVFLIVLLGAILRGSGFLTEAFSTVLNKFIFWVALPCLLFTTIAGSSFDPKSIDASVVMLLSTLIIAAVAWFGAPLLGIAPASRGSFTQSVFRSNNAYVGLPVVMAAYAGLGRADSVHSLAMLTLAPTLILYNVLAVVVLTPFGSDDEQSQGIPWGRIVRGILSNPLIVACVLGGIALTVKLEFPTGADRTLKSLASMAGPGALIALGSSLTRERMRASIRAAHFASLLKLVVCPAIGWVVAMAFGLDSDARFITLIYLASPTAVASFVMAQSMKGDAVLAGGSVAVSTVYSVLALAAVLLIAGPGADGRTDVRVLSSDAPAMAAVDAIPVSARPGIAVSIMPQQGIVRRIAGDTVAIETLVGPGQDPHTYEPTPRQLVRLSGAEVLFTIGLPFERTLVAKLAASHPQLTFCDAAADYPLMPMDGDGHAHGSPAAALSDPHLWLSPSGIVHQAAIITEKLSELYPDEAATYRANFDKLAAEVGEFDLRAAAALAPHAGQPLFVYHPAWGHFAAAYGLRQVAIEKHGGAPGAKHAANLLEAAAAAGIRGVLVESDTEAGRVAALFGRQKEIEVKKIRPLESDPLQLLDHTLEAVLQVLPPAVVAD